jgi:hypothetical protein
MVFALPTLRAAQPTSDAVDSNDGATETVTTTTTTAVPPSQPAAPGWIHLIRLAAVAGPIAFLILAWLIGAVVHFTLVRREHAQFPVMRGTRTPQTVPMIISAGLFVVPVVLFALFEYRSRLEISRGIGVVVDQWQPVTARAWITLVICLVFAIAPWLLARRADTIS